jgi:hypothetical protein
MPAIETFDAKAPRRGTLDVSSVGTGASESWDTLARGASQIAGRLGQMADKAALREGAEAGQAAASAVAMPSVDFAFEAVKAPDGTPYPSPKVSAKSSNARAAAARDYLIKTHGFAPHMAQAVAGHYMAESGMNPDVKPGDNGTAFGLAQWRGDRLTGLQRFAAAKGRHWKDFNVQLDYTVHELDTSESTAGRQLRASRNVEEATAAFMSFERPQGWTPQNPRGGHNFAGRLAFAQGLAGASTVAAPDASVAADLSPPIQGAPQAPMVRAKAVITGQIGALPRMQAGTLRGDAYNQAALQIHSNRADTALRAEMDALAINHQDDPQALSGALDALWQGHASELPNELRPALEQTFQRGRASLVSSSVENFNSKLEKEALASFEANITARADAVLKRAVTLPSTPEGDAALSKELADVGGRIDTSNLAPAEKLRLKRDLENGVIEQRVISGFENEKDPAKRAAYAARFEDEWKASDGFAGRVNLNTRDKLRTTMALGIQADEADAIKRGTALQKTIDGQIGFLKKGLPVSNGAISAIRSEVERTGSTELSANLAFMSGLANWQRAAVGMPVAALDGQITALRRQMSEQGATEAAVTTLDVMEGLQKEMGAALKNDPLTFAQASGVHTVEPLDFSDGAKLQVSLAERSSDAAAVSQRYGIKPQYFTQTERDGITKLFEDNPASLPQLAMGIASGLGKDAPKALAELSKDAPVLAHVGGLLLANGNQKFAVDLADGLSMRKMDGYKSALPTDKALADAAAETFGAALSRNPELQSAALSAATAAFERRMAKKGLSIKDFDTAGSPARREYQAALNEALGATFQDGVQFGGITEVNGAETIAPADIEATALQTAIDNLSVDDLAAFDIRPANGIAFTTSQMRRAQLVAVGDGTYRMALGDPFSDEPQFIKTHDGKDFELDMRTLVKRQKAQVGADNFGVVAPAEQFGIFDPDGNMFVVP